MSDQQEKPTNEYRSASMNAALGIAAASPFLNAAGQVIADKLTEKPPADPPPRIELPPGVERD